MKNYVVLGAGISGLALAWNLKKKHPDSKITLVEKSSRVGGWIRSIDRDGFLFELGPRSCRPLGAGVATLQLIEELGLQDQVITGQTTKRYLYVNGKLRRFPVNPFSLFFGVLKDLITPVNNAADESIHDFFSRRFNSHIVHRLIDPMALGIYAGDIRHLSIKSCFPQIHQWEKEHGSVIRGMFLKKNKAHPPSNFIKSVQKSSLFSFKNGMETLPRELFKRLDAETLLSTAVTSLEFHSDHAAIGLSSGKTLHADHVYSTLSARDLGLLWTNPALEKVPANSIAVLNLGFKRKLNHKEGFGYLIPSGEQEPILGVVFDSCIFPQQNHFPEETRLTVMMKPGACEEEMLGQALHTLSRHLHINTPPDEYLFTLAKDAIPQYGVGHSSLIESIQTPQCLTITGSSFHGVAVNDCVANGVGLKSP